MGSKKKPKTYPLCDVCQKQEGQVLMGGTRYCGICWDEKYGEKKSSAGDEISRGG